MKRMCICMESIATMFQQMKGDDDDVYVSLRALENPLTAFPSTSSVPNVDVHVSGQPEVSVGGRVLCRVRHMGVVLTIGRNVTGRDRKGEQMFLDIPLLCRGVFPRLPAVRGPPHSEALRADVLAVKHPRTDRAVEDDLPVLALDLAADRRDGLGGRALCKTAVVIDGIPHAGRRVEGGVGREGKVVEAVPVAERVRVVAGVDVEVPQLEAVVERADVGGRGLVVGGPVVLGPADADGLLVRLVADRDVDGDLVGVHAGVAEAGDGGVVDGGFDDGHVGVGAHVVRVVEGGGGRGGHGRGEEGRGTREDLGGDEHRGGVVGWRRVVFGGGRDVGKGERHTLSLLL
ncbi:uncharacterized protein EV422DRAFT_381197 [Fimicolochytrium jonesii]|uniref:uncharacterized protein n=1 Tax=Fimicolochytrium jonesii TaxID=1396493 RepID=UPI0022FDFE51|nr:uncharacterized protein EV422DRAFT_381197 [Fimicolochytrium jonesii]KAI8822853.1 hypothetical protein EV422DRAFT_381197 [Fimicolochytrium jonesii]